MTDKDKIKFAIRYLKQGLKSKRTPPLYEELMKELGFVSEKELLEAILKTQEENKNLRKAYSLCDEANINLREKINALRKELNERSYVTLEEELTKYVTLEEELTKAKDLIKWFIWYFKEGNPNLEPYKHKVAEAEQFLKDSEVEK